MKKLSRLSCLVAKCDWNGVYLRLQSAPEEASIPIPTGTKGKVYALHQAICSKNNPVPRKVLISMIEQFPSALDQNAILGACENPRLTRGSMKILLDRCSKETCCTIQNRARHYASVAVKKKNTSSAQLLIERFPSILKGDILAHACMHGTAKMVDIILAAGFHQHIGKAGGLFLKTSNGEDALDIAIRLYDEKDDERRHMLVTCLQYANANKMGIRAPSPDYPVILAALGLVPGHILKSFLKLYAHEVTMTNQAGKYTILKAIHMSMKEKKDDELPSIFKSAMLVDACRNGKLRVVQILLQKSTKYSGKELSKALKLRDKKSALDVALELFEENDKVSSEILKTCIQYANAAESGMKAPSSNYPTLVAAVGIVPPQDLLNIGKQYCQEIAILDRIGKLALKKLLKMAEEEIKFARYLDRRCEYPLSFNTSRVKLESALESIPCDRPI